MSSSWCDYKNIFGEPNKGIRQKLRLLNISIIDFVLMIIFGLVLAKIFKLKNWSGIGISFLTGLVAHKIFCVDTTVDTTVNTTVNRLINTTS